MKCAPLLIAAALTLAACRASIGPPTPIHTPTQPIDLLAKGLDAWHAHPPDPQSQAWALHAGILTSTGNPRGYLRTQQAYTNYRLTIEWRWTDSPGNSGVLLHLHPPDRVWPRSIEAQLAYKSAGDLWVIRGAHFAEHTARLSRRTPKRHPHAERPIGEWNRIEITCQDDRIEVTINGLLQNVATQANLTGGHIALQSEGAPIAFRHIHLSPLHQDGNHNP